MNEQDPKIKVNPVSKYAKVDPTWAGLPNLLEAIASTHWDNGTPREVWTLGITYENGPQVTVKLNDKPKRRSAQIIAPSIQEAYLELDEGIKNGSLQWRAWKDDKRR